MSEEVKSIEMSRPPEACIELFFQGTIQGIRKYSKYKESNGSLDYFLTRRILATMFNNMRELDLEFVSDELYEIYTSFKNMAQVYNQFKSKIAHAGLAFENVFLQQQKDYIKLLKENELLESEHSTLSAKEKSIRNEVEQKNTELKEGKLSKDQANELLSEIKKLKGQQVDLIHKAAVAKEHVEANEKLLESFRERYEALFKELFHVKSGQYEEKVISILNAMAYVFDHTLWKYAKKSKQIRKFFKNAQIKGEFCTTTYMKYYLSTLDRGKMSQEQVEMQKLYDYLKEKVGAYILIVHDSKEEALNIKVTLEATTLDYKIEVFIDEVRSIQFAKTHHVSLVILSDTLTRLLTKQYIDTYKRKVDDDIRTLVVTPSKKEDFGATATLSTKYLRSELIQKVKEVLEE